MSDTQNMRLKKRYRAEKRFRLYGIGAIFIALAILVGLLGSIISSSLPAFTHTHIAVDVYMDAEAIDPDALDETDWRGLVRDSFFAFFPDVQSRGERRLLGQLLSVGASDMVNAALEQNPQLIGTTKRFWLSASGDVDLLMKGIINRNLPENERVISDRELTWIDRLAADERIRREFAVALFANGDSTYPEMAGVKSALVGTALTLLVTLLISFPVGVMAAIYLQELAPRNRFTDLIEVNINNLAAVPSIIFGLLGLAVFINFFYLPRSAPLVGGMVLALMTLPTIIVATRAALVAVPPSIREAALGVGASRMQVIMHHVLPLALPGILTGTIIGLAQAAGETAPLLMIGMMAFIVDVPTSITDSATVLPAQVYMWANNPERAFVARTSAGIVILLSVLLAMNAIAIFLRKKFEKRW